MIKAFRNIVNWVSVVFMLTGVAGGREAQGSTAGQEPALLRTLKSSASPGEKAMACKMLAVYGSAKAVPVLAPLLSDPRLSSWALIALEAIPGPEADKALRKAAGKLHGELLTGVIDTIGDRRDAGAVGILTRSLKDEDPVVASAAAISLGKIGTSKAADALRRALDKSPENVRSAVAEGCVRCAEHLLADGKTDGAVKLYDAVWKAPAPKAKVLEGLRGAILARGSAGVPLLLAQLRSDDRDTFNLGLRVARELPGSDATAALIAFYRSANSLRQPLLLQALADRGETATTDVVKEAASQGDAHLRLVAVEILDRLGDATALDVLLIDACSDDAELAQAAQAALARLGGKDVDSQVLARLAGSTGRMCQALMTTAASRGIESALPFMAQALADPDTETRATAVQALKIIGGADQIADLARALEKSDNAAERNQIKSVMVALSGKAGAKCVPALLPLTKSTKVEDKKAALQALVAAGGSDALAAVAAASQDSDASLAGEAVRTLSTWPNAWPEDVAVLDVLLHLSKSDPNSAHAILALRGYLQFLLGDEKMAGDAKLAKMQQVLPLLQRPEEKITAISVLQGIPSSEALNLLGAFAAEPAVADDACVALVELAAKKQPSVSLDERKKALALAIEKSTNDETKRKAEGALKSLQ